TQRQYRSATSESRSRSSLITRPAIRVFGHRFRIASLTFLASSAALARLGPAVGRAENGDGHKFVRFQMTKIGCVFERLDHLFLEGIDLLRVVVNARFHGSPHPTRLASPIEFLAHLLPFRLGAFPLFFFHFRRRHDWK